MQKDRIFDAVLYAKRGRCYGREDVLWLVKFAYYTSPLDRTRPHLFRDARLHRSFGNDILTLRRIASYRRESLTCVI